MQWVFIRGLFSEDVTQLCKVEWQDDNECGTGIGVSVAVAQPKVMSQHFHREPEENYEGPRNVPAEIRTEYRFTQLAQS